MQHETENRRFPGSFHRYTPYRRGDGARLAPLPQPIQEQQPSGETFTATLHGDEWFHWTEAEDGAVVVQGSDGYWYYSQYANGELSALSERYGIDAKPDGALTGDALGLAVESSPPAGAKAALQKSAEIQKSEEISKPTGPEPLLVILVSFTDIGIEEPDSYWSGKMFNDYSKYPTKTNTDSSVDDYYKENSDGKFYFTPAAESYGTKNDGVIRVSLPFAHPLYRANDDSEFDQDSWDVATAALQAANPYINFARYDTDHNGDITPNELHIEMILAGYEQACGAVGQAVWAHSFGLENLLKLDGVTVGDNYTQQGEIQQVFTGYNYIYYPATIGVLCHELGHSLGLPDLYDTENGATSLGLGVYSLMASGNWEYNDAPDCYPGSSPVHLDAWCKSLLGFAPVDTYYSGSYTLNSIATGSYNILKVPTTDPEQYFILENRQNDYGYDKPLSWYFNNGGIAIYHIDENVLDNAMSLYGEWYNINNDPTHKAVDLEEANEGILGHSQLDTGYYPEYPNSPKYNHLFRAGSPSQCNSTFTSSTVPSSNLYNGSASGVSIYVTSTSADSMNVSFGLGILGLTADKASPQRQNRTVRFTCSAIGASNITYNFGVYQNGTRIGGMDTDSYSSANTYDWTPKEPGSGYTIRVSVLADGVTTPITQDSGEYTVLADTTPPVITAISGGSPVTGGGWARNNVTLTFSDADGDDVISGTYSLNGQSNPVNPAGMTLTSDGSYEIDVSDLAGNSASLSFSLDKTAPAITATANSSNITSGSGTAASDVTVTVSDAHLTGYSVTKDGNPYDWPDGGVFDAEGHYAVSAQDTAGNESSFVFIIDRTPPVILATDSLSNPVAGGSILDSDVTVSVTELNPVHTTATRNGSACAWPAGGKFTSDGAYVVTSVDIAGNTASIAFTIDKTAPVITAKNTSGRKIARGSFNKTAITVTAADRTAVAWSATRNGAPYDWPAGGKFTSEGVYVATATDAAGNASSFSFTIDLSYPVITASREDGTALASKGYSNLPVTVAISDTSLSKYSVRRNGRSCVWPAGSLFTADGSYAVTATDRLGRTRTFSFTIDFTAPAIRGRTSGATVIDGGIYRYVTISVSEKYLSKKSATKNGVSIRWPGGSRFSASGAYTVTAVDKAGNSSSFSFTVDSTKPSVSVTTLAGTAVRSGRTAYGGAIVAVSDAHLASKTVKLGKSYITWPDDNKFTAKGTYYITATDAAGNKTTYTFYVK